MQRKCFHHKFPGLLGSLEKYHSLPELGLLKYDEAYIFVFFSHRVAITEAWIWYKKQTVIIICYRDIRG